jgi:hypothetical protein
MSRVFRVLGMTGAAVSVTVMMLTSTLIGTPPASAALFSPNCANNSIAIALPLGLGVLCL